MSRIINALAKDDYKLFIDFDDGSSIIFNMKRLVETIHYIRLKDLPSFQCVRFDDKSVFWETADKKLEYLPLRLSVDTILFSLRS